MWPASRSAMSAPGATPPPMTRAHPTRVASPTTTTRTTRARKLGLSPCGPCSPSPTPRKYRRSVLAHRADHRRPWPHVGHRPHLTRARRRPVPKREHGYQMPMWRRRRLRAGWPGLGSSVDDALRQPGGAGHLSPGAGSCRQRPDPAARRVPEPSGRHRRSVQQLLRAGAELQPGLRRRPMVQVARGPFSPPANCTAPH